MEAGISCELFKTLMSSPVITTLDQATVDSLLRKSHEMFWSDVDDPRGFHIFDTETLELTTINNPYKLFYNIYYEDTPHQMFDASKYKNKIVKLL